MKIIKKEINFKAKLFKVRIQVEPNSDDCWHLFNLISKGDLVYGSCHRKIQKDTLTGLVQNQKRRINVLLRVMVSV